jgi:hypothetical protein
MERLPFAPLEPARHLPDARKPKEMKEVAAAHGDDWHQSTAHF